MKIAITAMGPDLEARVDPRFGRAAFFLIVDTETQQFEVIDNTVNVNAAGGAGTRSAECVVTAGARHVLTGDVGPKAQRGLQAGGVGVTTGLGGTCREALEAFQAHAAE